MDGRRALLADALAAGNHIPTGKDGLLPLEGQAHLLGADMALVCHVHCHKSVVQIDPLYSVGIRRAGARIGGVASLC